LCLGKLPGTEGRKQKAEGNGLRAGEPISAKEIQNPKSKIQIPQGGWVVSSETCALMTVGAEFVREIAPGEIVTIGAEGLTSYAAVPSASQAMCVFEYIYFARPDSVINGVPLYTARQNMGRELAREHPAHADIVIGVP